ncbi:acylpyruvase FAHD1, mitochondrial [Strongylocentrotus purpuratus]|uniref:Oxaloacetate tautomerase FAHD1, mitochondrial n=1 Tax=Strongylocentrotus purpuratus TaxID=7668 RepID=A0A7M7RFC9_STRPU|nr:acylpyruvase FAHD1, mitochondrial [Strongylocentrotus purpuratus]|eukprot:XP_786493.3 PREDICTED: acylpyruvase FAHD1, mitochondrial [Strongylocentrotus purpuratus]
MQRIAISTIRKMSSNTEPLNNFANFGKKIVCIGRNYAEHAAELGNKVPTKPMIFLKPTSAYLQEGQGNIKLPPNCTEIHHEVELGIVIGKSGSNILESSAMEHVGGYTLALDMTERKLQSDLKSKGHPWSLAKGFDTSCPVGGFLDASRIDNVDDVRLWLKVNGETKQDGNTKDMIFRVPTLLSFISQYMTLEVGDLVLTGTPSGVGPVRSKDVIVAGLNDDLLQIEFSVE